MFSANNKPNMLVSFLFVELENENKKQTNECKLN